MQVDKTTSKILKKQAIKVFHKFMDVFAWTQDDFWQKVMSIVEHVIDLITGTKVVEQRHYKMNPN